MRLRNFIIYFGIIFTVFSLTQCHKEKFTTDSSAQLEFSRDTVFFDTVFTSVGSTTQYLKVRNRHNESIRISEISLEGGSNSQFRINVDGLDGDVQRDVEILPNDSIFIFVEVTIDPTDQTLPFLVEDNIRFTTNGNTQHVLLQSWGQDAHFHGGLSSCYQPFSEIIPAESNVTWHNDKPHVIYGILAIDSAATLTIDPGTQIYCHGKSGIYAYKSSIIVNGNLGSEVVFQGDRLEASYSDLAGQWGIQLDCPVDGGVGQNFASIVRGGIWIFQSPGSAINYAVIKNGNMGIQVDTTGVNYSSLNYAVQIRNTTIQNMTGIGLWGQGGSIQGKNLLISNCGQSCAYLGIGGKYQMDNCTFGNYWSDNSRTAPSFVLNNYYEDVNKNIQARELYDCVFNNCIMFGNNAFLTDFSEFVIDTDDLNGTVPLNYKFRNCLVDTDQNVEDDALQRFSNMSNNQAPFLCDPSNYNFHISNGSLLMSGSFTSANNLNEDIGGMSWASTGMWKGCYSFDVSDPSPCE